MTDVTGERSTFSGLLTRNYGVTEYLDADGRVKKSKGSGDAVAMAMLGLGESDLKKVAKAAGVEFGVGANLGLARMALGNRLRKLVRSGTPVAIGEFIIKKLDQRVVPPSIKAAAEARKAQAKEAKAEEPKAKRTRTKKAA